MSQLTPIQLVEAGHREFSTRLAAEFKKRGECVTCSQGCSACCAEAVYVNEAEAANCLLHVPPQHYEYVAHQTQLWAMKTMGSGLLNQTEPRAWDWLAVGAMCPFLKDGLCLVYEHRPLGCRSHNAVGDPKLCGTPETRKRQKFVITPELNHACASLIFCAGRTHDHLGIYLAEQIFDMHIPSAARVQYPPTRHNLTKDGVFEMEILNDPPKTGV